MPTKFSYGGCTTSHYIPIALVLMRSIDGHIALSNGDKRETMLENVMCVLKCDIMSHSTCFCPVTCACRARYC